MTRHGARGIWVICPRSMYLPTARATIPVLAPRMKLKHLRKKAVMIHAGGDNYSDDPKPLGGGGARMACGVAGK